MDTARQPEFNWTTATPEERREHWATKLEDDSYNQISGKLRNSGGHCCLGVGCDLMDPTRWCTDDWYGGLVRNHELMPPDEFIDQVGLSSDEICKLSDANDYGESFATIAKRIRTGNYA